jgi:hypothetical protein
MEKDQIDERIDSLFAELRRLIEPVNGHPSSIMDFPQDGVHKRDRSCSLEKRGGEPVCPFLKTSWDDTIRYGFPHENNLCYKAFKAQSVSMADQEKVCLNRRYTKCQIFLTETQKRQNKNLLSPLLNFIQR